MIKNKKTIRIRQLVQSLHGLIYTSPEVKTIINEIHGIFQEITGITGDEFKVEYLAAIPTAKGKALGLNHAAQCLLDYTRTHKFLTAIISAIYDKQEKYPGQKIRIFYAGCGPYAPFFSLVAPLFQPEDVQFSLLEINKDSLTSAQELIAHLELTDYVQDVFLADAVTFIIPQAETFDILISETLDALLYRECYVPILFNLLPQCKPSITVVPDNVTLDLKLVTHNGDQDIKKEYQANKFLDVREAVAKYGASHKKMVQLPDKNIDLNALNIHKYEGIIVDTTVHIYKDITLKRNESSLTIPFQMKLDQPFQYSTMIFTYQLDPEVELKYRLE